MKMRLCTRGEAEKMRMEKFRRILKKIANFEEIVITDDISLSFASSFEIGTYNKSPMLPVIKRSNSDFDVQKIQTIAQ